MHHQMMKSSAGESAGGADVPFFGMSAAHDSDGPIVATCAPPTVRSRVADLFCKVCGSPADNNQEPRT